MANPFTVNCYTGTATGVTREQVLPANPSRIALTFSTDGLGGQLFFRPIVPGFTAIPGWEQNTGIYVPAGIGSLVLSIKDVGGLVTLAWDVGTLASGTVWFITETLFSGKCGK